MAQWSEFKDLRYKTYLIIRELVGNSKKSNGFLNRLDKIDNKAKTELNNNKKKLTGNPPPYDLGVPTNGLLKEIKKLYNDVQREFERVMGRER